MILLENKNKTFPLFLFSLKPEKLEKDLDRYAESAGVKKGAKINVSEFAAYLEVPVSDPLADMFSLFDEVAHHPVGVGLGLGVGNLRPQSIHCFPCNVNIL